MKVIIGLSAMKVISLKLHIIPLQNDGCLLEHRLILHPIKYWKGLTMFNEIIVYVVCVCLLCWVLVEWFGDDEADRDHWK